MIRRLLATFAVAAALPLAAATPTHALSKNCDMCSDLPGLYRELLDQEFLRNKFDRWISEAYYPRSIEAMQASAASALSAAMSGDLYGVLKPRGAGGSGSASAAPAFGTETKNCGLIEYVKDRNGKTIERPVTPQQVRAKLCKPLADHTLAHEGHHQASCRSGKLKTVEEFARDDRDAYRAGVAVLRAYIADLARRCSWSGSTAATRPDGSAVVPKPAEIFEIRSAVARKADLLGRGQR